MNVRRRGVGYQEGGYQNQLSANQGAGGSKFLSFWDNVTSSSAPLAKAQEDSANLIFETSF